MRQLYHYECLTSEHSILPMKFFVKSLMNDSTSNDLIPFDTSLHTMLDEIMMWCITTNLPEPLVRFLLSLLPNFDFKVIIFLSLSEIICDIFRSHSQKHFYVSTVL